MIISLNKKAAKESPLHWSHDIKFNQTSLKIVLVQNAQKLVDGYKLGKF